MRLGTATGVDWDAQQVKVAQGEPLPFDVLVLAAGAVTSDYGIDGVAEHAFPLKSPEEALRLRHHVLARFERADADPALIDSGELTFVVVGGGPTGVELAGALVELIDNVVRKDFPSLDVDRAHVVLIEATDHLIDPFSPRSRENARDTLAARGVEVRLGTAVDAVTADEVHLVGGDPVGADAPRSPGCARAPPLPAPPAGRPAPPASTAPARSC